MEKSKISLLWNSWGQLGGPGTPSACGGLQGLKAAQLSLEKPAPWSENRREVSPVATNCHLYLFIDNGFLPTKSGVRDQTNTMYGTGKEKQTLCTI